jgi:hypothetical protein
LSCSRARTCPVCPPYQVSKPITQSSERWLKMGKVYLRSYDCVAIALFGSIKIPYLHLISYGRDVWILREVTCPIVQVSWANQILVGVKGGYGFRVELPLVRIDYLRYRSFAQLLKLLPVYR